MVAGVSRFVFYLRSEVMLPSEENPWGFNPLELKLLYEICGRGRMVKEVAREYFSCKPSQELTSTLYSLVQLCRWRIPQKDPLEQAHPRVLQIWRQVVDGVSKKLRTTDRIIAPDPETWENGLLTQDPLIPTSEWIEQLRREAEEAASQAEDREALRAERERRGAEIRARQERATRHQAALRQHFKAPSPAAAERKPAEEQPRVESVSRSSSPQTARPQTCPRCRGTMLPERDLYGEYSTCLSCGYVHEAVTSPPIDLLEKESDLRERGRQSPHGARHGKMKLD